MKKKILLSLCCICLIVITGCGNNKKEEKNKVATDVNKTDTSEDKLTLENFKKVMNEHGLTVIDDKDCDEKSANCVYTAYDEREDSFTAYMFSVYGTENIATSFWEGDLNNLRDSYTITVKDEKNRKLEYYYGTSGIRTIIYYYGKKTSLYVNHDDYGNKDTLTDMRKVLAEFGYTDNADTNTNTNANTNNTSSNDDVIKTKDYTIKYGTYKGTATSGGYQLTSKATISKDKMQLETGTCEYAIKDNVIYCKNADAIQIIATGNNQFTDASSVYTYTLED